MSSCKKDELFPTNGYEDVTITSMFNINIFVNRENKYFEPDNFRDFLPTFKMGDRYWLKYRYAKEQTTLLQVGPRITIVQLKLQDK